MNLGQALVLSRIEWTTTGYARAWTATESLLVLLEVAAVLEFASWLLKGRLNATIRGLRWFGFALAIAALLAAALPLGWQTGEGWQQIVGFLMRTRGYLALALFFFLFSSSAVLIRQPVPVAKGLLLHGRYLGGYFLITAVTLLGGSRFSRQQVPHLAQFYMAGATLLFAAWVIALWNAPVVTPALRVDPALAAQAEDDYREFRDRVRAFRS